MRGQRFTEFANKNRLKRALNNKERDNAKETGTIGIKRSCLTCGRSARKEGKEEAKKRTKTAGEPLALNDGQSENEEAVTNVIYS